MSLYLIVLFMHSCLRWLVLALALALIVASARGLAGGGAFGRGHERLHAIFVGVVDTQFTLGLLLYLWLSPYVRGFYASVALGMKDANLRFFGVEHVFSMLIAIIIIHVVRARSKRLNDGRVRHRRVLISTLCALVLMLVAVPWPMLKYGRPLLRGL